MRLCMYMCVYTRTAKCAHAYTHTHMWALACMSPCVRVRITHIALCTYAHTYIHTCMHTFPRTYVHAYTHTYIHTYIHADMRTCIHTHISTCIRTYTYIYIYVHTYYIYISNFLQHVEIDICFSDVVGMSCSLLHRLLYSSLIAL